MCARSYCACCTRQLSRTAPKDLAYPAAGLLALARNEGAAVDGLNFTGPHLFDHIENRRYMILDNRPVIGAHVNQRDLSPAMFCS